MKNKVTKTAKKLYFLKCNQYHLLTNLDHLLYGTMKIIIYEQNSYNLSKNWFFLISSYVFVDETEMLAYIRILIALSGKSVPYCWQFCHCNSLISLTNGNCRSNLKPFLPSVKPHKQKNLIILLHKSLNFIQQAKKYYLKLFSSNTQK